MFMCLFASARGGRPSTYLRIAAAPIAAALILGWFIARARDDRALKRPLKVATGSSATTRMRLLNAFVEGARVEGVPIEIAATKGSVEACRKVESGEVDLALVLGSRDFSEFPRLRQIAALHVEPMHLLVKADLYESVSSDIHSLEGKRVLAVGFADSATLQFSNMLLDMLGLRFESDDPAAEAPRIGAREGGASESDRDRADEISTPDSSPIVAGAKAAAPKPIARAGIVYRANFDLESLAPTTRADEIPDAIFVVSTLPSLRIRELVERFEYRLVPLPYADAIALSAIEEPHAVLPDSHASILHKEFIHEVTIPQFAYQIDPPVPRTAIRTLGLRVLLVGRDDLDPDRVESVLKLIFRTRFARLVRPRLDVAGMKGYAELPWHAGSLSYFNHDEPFITAESIDELEKTMTIVGTIAGGMLVSWQWIRSRKAAARDRRFQVYLMKVSEIDRRALDFEIADSFDVASLALLQRELGVLKNEAIEKFAEGEIGGESLLNGFLAHVNDSRDNITRLILHARSGDVAAREPQDQPKNS